MKYQRNKISLFLFLFAFLPVLSFSQVDMGEYADHQACLGRCYANQSECEFTALNSWFDCWRYCWDNYGPNSGIFEYSPYVAYYHEGCENGCDITFDQTLLYCDLNFDQCECDCIRETMGLWGWVFGYPC